MGQTVNLLAFAFGGSNPSVPTPQQKRAGAAPRNENNKDIGCYSSVVEHFLGKEEVTSSSLVNSSLRHKTIKKHKNEKKLWQKKNSCALNRT